MCIIGKLDWCQNTAVLHLQVYACLQVGKTGEHVPHLEPARIAIHAYPSLVFPQTSWGDWSLSEIAD